MSRRMTEDRFWQRVDKSGGDGACWPWIGSKHADGYGKLRWSGASLLAHRTAYELTNGKIPGGLCVRHKCDNRPCCNPAHLEVGTWADNVNDKVERGRQIRGEQSPQAKLTAAEVEDIRRGFRNGTTRYELADRFGVSHAQICNIINGRRWAGSPTSEPGQDDESWKETLRERIRQRKAQKVA